MGLKKLIVSLILGVLLAGIAGCGAKAGEADASVQQEEEAEDAVQQAGEKEGTAQQAEKEDEAVQQAEEAEGAAQQAGEKEDIMQGFANQVYSADTKI